MSGTSRVTLAVEGMSCGSCRRQVEEALERVAGVQEASVDLAKGTATVEYDPTRVNPAWLAQAIRRAGYGVEMPGELPLAARGPAGVRLRLRREGR